MNNNENNKLSRKVFLKWTGIFAGVLALSCWLSAAETSRSATVPRNVLLIAVDDLRPQMRCYGDADAITPNMDKLAEQGMVFLRAYCQQAVCNPSRASLMTGLRPDTIRVWDLQTNFRTHSPDVVTLPQYFMNHGYYAEGIGKLYHGQEGFDDPQSWSKMSFATIQLRYANGVGGGNRLAATECADVPDNAYVDGKVADAAVESLRTLSVSKRPFFLGVGFRKPHLPFAAPKKYWDMQMPERIAKVPNPLPPVDVPKIALHNWVEMRRYTDIPNVGELTREQVAHLRHGYYAAMSYTDAQIGKVLAELDRTGLRASTVVCLYGDHGWHLGEQGLWCKTTNFELDTRAPLIISVPGQSTAGSRTTSLVEFVDVYPTLVELCNLPPSAHLQGTSLVPVLRDPSKTVKDVAFSQFPRGKIMGYSMRTDRYRFTRWVDELDHSKVEALELYDHQTDPQETINVANHPANADLVASLTEQFAAGIQKQQAQIKTVKEKNDE